MTKRTTGILLGVLLVVSIGVAWPAMAQDEASKAQAREQFNRGIEQYAAGQYEVALESFQEAYRLSPHPMVRVNMANCYDRLGKPVEALFHFERFLSETEGDRSRAEQRTEVTSAVRRLQSSVGQLNLRVIPDGSLVRVDDTDERRSPILEPIVLAAGDHVVTVKKPGFATIERRVQVRGGASESVNITLDRESVAAAVVPAPAPVVAAAREPVPAPLVEEEPPAAVAESHVAVQPLPLEPEPSAEESFRDDSVHMDSDTHSIFTPPVIIASVVSGTFLIGGALMGLGALKANSDFDSFSAQSRNPALSMMEQQDAREAAFAAADRADGRALTADIFFAGALISGAVAAYFVLTQDDSNEADDVAFRVSPVDASLRVAF